MDTRTFVAVLLCTILAHISVSRQENIILCNNETLPWKKAIQNCLDAEGTPVSSDMGFQTLGLKDNITFWTADYWTKANYMQQGAASYCGYLSFNGRYVLGQEEWENCSAINYYIRCAKGLVHSRCRYNLVDVYNGTWLNATHADYRITASESNLRALKAPAGKYWTYNVYSIHKVTNQSHHAILYADTCGTFQTTSKTNKGNRGSDVCHKEFTSLCKLDPNSEHRGFTTSCFKVADPVLNDPDSDASHYGILIGAPVCVILVFLLIVAVAIIIFQQKRLKQKTEFIAPHPGVISNNAPATRNKQSSASYAGGKLNQELLILNVEKQAQLNLIDNMSYNREREQRSDSDSSSYNYTYPSNAGIDGEVKDLSESYSYATLERKVTDTGMKNKRNKGNTTSTDCCYENVKQNPNRFHSNQNTMGEKRGVNNKINYVFSKSITDLKRKQTKTDSISSDYDSTIQVPRKAFTSNVYNTFEITSEGNYNATAFRSLKDSSIDLTYDTLEH